jgi:hypothetical protein
MRFDAPWARTFASCLGSSLVVLLALTPGGEPLSAARSRNLDAVAPHVALTPQPSTVAKARGTTAKPARATTKRPRPIAIDRTTPIFGGLGAWIDKFDYSTLQVQDTVARMQQAGVRTLYIQSGTSLSKTSIKPGVRRWLVASHRAGIRVVGWYLPYYSNMQRDIKRTIAIARYRYAGHRFDGLGVDIEISGPISHAAWNRRIAGHLRAVRTKLGAKYPIAAIPPPPLQMRLAPNHWGGFPWRKVAAPSDAILLMSYWSVRTGCPVIIRHCAYNFTRDNVRLTRKLAGPDVDIHVIGGVADGISRAELLAFVRGAIDGGADGASMYDIASMPKAWWSPLSLLDDLGRVG